MSMISFQNIAKNYAIQAGGIVFTVGFQFLIIDRMSVAEYGVFNVIWSSVLIAAIISVAGMDRLLIYKLSNAPLSKQANYYFLTLRIILVISVVLMVVLYFYYKYQDYSISLILFALMILLLHSLIKANEGVLIANEKTTTVNFWVSFVRPLLFVIILFGYFDLFYTISLKSVLMTQLAVLLFVFIVTAPRAVILSGKKNGGFSRRISHKWLKSAMPFFLIGSSFILNQNVDILMINYYLNEESVAYYSFSAKIVLYASMGLGLYATMISPHIVKNKLDKLKLDKFNKMYMMLSVISVSAIVFFCLFLFEVLFREYIESKILIYLLATVLLVRACFGPVETYMSMLGNSVSSSKILIISTVLNIVLNVFLIKYIGVKGAVIATIISTLYWHYMMYRFLFNKYGIKSGLLKYV